MSHPSNPQHRAVFFDRDGTLNEEIGYLSSVEDWRWLPGAIEAIHQLKDAGWLIVVITNQAGIGRGYYTEQAVARVHDHLRADLTAAGTSVDGIYYCPHHPDDGCACRKPKTGLFEQAARDLSIDLKASCAVGDKLSDLLPGQQLGGRTILVLTGYGQSEWLKAQLQKFQPDHVAHDLEMAVRWIMAQSPAC